MTALLLTLYKARQKAKMTQKDLSVKLGLSQPYIAKLESGEANPTLGTAGKILAELGLRLVIETAPLASQPDDSSEEEDQPRHPVVKHPRPYWFGRSPA